MHACDLGSDKPFRVLQYFYTRSLRGCPLKIFVSYTSSDRDWAHWIGWQLQQAGHEPFVHEWEIGAGQNIAGWMEERVDQADRLLGVFSDAYCKVLYSQSERWTAYWENPRGGRAFLLPIEVRKVSKWPALVSPLKRLSLVGLDEIQASKQLLTFLERPMPPTEKPIFSGSDPTPAIRCIDDTSRSRSFSAGRMNSRRSLALCSSGRPRW